MSHLFLVDILILARGIIPLTAWAVLFKLISSAIGGSRRFRTKLLVWVLFISGALAIALSSTSLSHAFDLACNKSPSESPIGSDMCADLQTELDALDPLPEVCTGLPSILLY